jgi:predicted nucleic acid-binding Zn ribbon protein
MIVKKCPFCGELLQNESIICRHCNRALSRNSTKEESTTFLDFEEAIRDYQLKGYDVISRMADHAILETRAPIAVGMLMLLLLIWPAAIFYLIKNNRKKYTVGLSKTSEGIIFSSGGTYEQLTRDKNRANTISITIILVLILLLVISSIVANL